MNLRCNKLRFLRRAALTLLEMMVAVTLLALIMVGLLAMFNQTQKALHAVNSQSDVFENARGAIQMLSRDFSEMAALGETNVVNAYALEVPSTVLALPSSSNLTTVFDEACWLSRANDEWRGIGYFVDGTNFGVGTLYRYLEVTNRANAAGLATRFARSPDVHRVSDGIVHFQLHAGYVSSNEFYRTSRGFQFVWNELPAFVDIELGVLEPNTLKQFQSLTNDSLTAAVTFLQNHVGNIHFFRQRVPIRNFLNPYRSNEVP
jgi:hypothetical protein